MFRHAVSTIAGILLLLGPIGFARSQEPASAPAAPGAPSFPKDLFRVSELAQAAADLRRAGEAFERLADSHDGLLAALAESLATMSSEFDPFGYKTAFRTLGRQAELIQKQTDIIQSLQQQNIERLQRENRRLKKANQRLRSTKAGP